MNDMALIHYLAAVTQGHIMLEKALITEHDFFLFEDMMRKKYGLPENSIYRDFRLIC